MTWECSLVSNSFNHSRNIEPQQYNLMSSSMAIHESSMARKPYQIIFSTRDDEIHYLQRFMGNCATYNSDPAQLTTWLRETGAFIVKEGYPETDHPFIILHLLIDDALDYYLAHEDIIFNFCDLRKLFLHKNNALAPLGTLWSLDSIATLTLNPTPPILMSTQLPGTTATSTGNPCATTFTFAQNLDNLTQNDIRKTIIEDLQPNTTKFSGNHRQDVVKWLKNIELKFETGAIPDSKIFDMISQLLDRGVFDWFQDHKTKFNNSWSEFSIHFKKRFNSPNRARIAMQKLNSYAQSPHQDIRGFWSEMRKLFQEADSQMCSSLKLELLLAMVNPSYHLDLLKQKLKDSEEFAVMAKDVENIYLAFQVMGQNTQSPTSLSSGALLASFDILPYSSSNSYQYTPYNNHDDINYRNVNTSHSNVRFSANTNRLPRNSSSNPSYTHDQTSSR